MTEENTISPTRQKRADALDALRGFAILLMVLSGTIAYHILPAWMYHAQEPPPTHTFNPHLAGLTWVDLVFPMFLFSMGAAIPLALSRRLAQGWTTRKILLYILKRGLLLGVFAIFLQHLRPLVINPNPSDQTWWIALLGFFLLFLMFVRWPDWIKSQYRRWLTVGGWLGTIGLLSVMRYPNGNGFSVERSDIILIVLTNMAIFGSLVWLFTKSNLLVRLGCLGLLFALRLSSTADGWVAWLWQLSPLPWIFQFDYLKYLFIVIPGTIAGDFIFEWIQPQPTAKTDAVSKIMENSWRKQHFYMIAILMLTMCVILLIGLQSRWIWQTTLLIIGLCSTSWLLFTKPISDTEYLIKKFYSWGVYWLALGLLFEPFEGGIKKDPATFSYFFVTTGIAFFILIIFTIIIDVFNQRRGIQLLIDNGKNPMIAYVGFANFLWPILGLTQLDTFIIEHTRSPFRGFMKGFFYTLIIAYLVRFFTHKKLFWRT